MVTTGMPERRMRMGLGEAKTWGWVDQRIFLERCVVRRSRRVEAWTGLEI